MLERIRMRVFGVDNTVETRQKFIGVLSEKLAGQRIAWAEATAFGRYSEAEKIGAEIDLLMKQIAAERKRVRA